MMAMTTSSSINVNAVRRGAARGREGTAVAPRVGVARATAWIGSQPSRFFAWVHVFDAHSPYKPPEQYRRACDKRRLTLENRRLREQVDGGGIEARLPGNSAAIERLRREVLDPLAASLKSSTA